MCQVTRTFTAIKRVKGAKHALLEGVLMFIGGLENGMSRHLDAYLLN